MTTKLRPAAMQLASQAYRSWIATVPAGLTLPQLLDHPFWALHVQRLGVNDLVRVVGPDLDIMLAVKAKAVNGVTMTLWPKMPTAAGSEAEDTGRAA
jgi:hypothetical protein